MFAVRPPASASSARFPIDPRSRSNAVARWFTRSSAHSSGYLMRCFAEFHDTQLGAFTRSAIHGRIEILSMVVFEQLAPDDFDVWAYEGELIVENPSEWPSAVPAEDDSVCSVSELPGLVEMSASGGTLSRDLGQVSFMVELCSGKEFRLAGSSVTLRLAPKGDHLERWVGPLWEDSTRLDVLFLPRDDQDR